MSCLTYFTRTLGAVAIFLLGLKSVQAQDATTGLILHYPLDESSGTQARELVSGQHGTVVDGNTSTPRTNVTWLSPGLHFDGSQAVITPASTGSGTFPKFTLSLWLKLDQHSDTLQKLVSRGVYPQAVSYSFYTARGLGNFLYNEPDTNGNSGNGSVGRSGFNVRNPYSFRYGIGQWYHVTVTFDGGRMAKYIDGVLLQDFDYGNTDHVLGESTGPLVFGWEAITTFTNFGLRGAMRDVRIYNRSLSGGDVQALFAASVYGPYKGLWVGQAQLNEVKRADGGGWEPSASALSKQVLIHIDEHGLVRLLDEVMLMRTRETTPIGVVVSDPANASLYDGVVERGGKLVGQRYSCAAMALPTNPALLTLNDGWLTSSWTLSSSDPNNPFRHKYHPDLAIGRALANTLRVQFTEGDLPNDNTVEGTLWESVEGIHKDTIEARGPITFTRVSSSGQLR